MADKFAVIGIDIGTSGVRAIMFDDDGFVISDHQTEYSLLKNPGKAELDINTVTDSFMQCISGCVEKAGGIKPVAVGVSAQMHSLIVVGSDGSPKTNLITWADGSAMKTAADLAERNDVDELYRITGCRVQHPMYPFAKVKHLKNEGIICSNDSLMTVKEYVFYRFFGVKVVDYTLAASQGYFDIRTCKWSEAICKDILGIQLSQLSEPVAPTYVIRGMKPLYAEKMGISADIPFVVGSGDGIMANIGSGVFDSGACSSTIGTSGAIRTTLSSPLLDPEGATWCYSFTKDSWVAGGAINNGGIVLKWLAEKFGKQIISDTGLKQEQVYIGMDSLAQEVSPGCDGLVFLPYLLGERSPDWNAGVRGMMFGLDYAHTNGHIFRAAMEGVMFRMFSVFEKMSAAGKEVRQIKASGGYTKSPFWMQIQADLFGREIHVPHSGEGSALGAAYVAMVATEMKPDLNTGLKAMDTKTIIKPNPENQEKYSAAYHRAMEIYGNNI